MTIVSAAGSIQDIFAKIKAIDAKHGKFDLVLCSGDFFGPPKEEYGPDDEVTRLLEGSLEGVNHPPIFPCLSPYLHFLV